MTTTLTNSGILAGRTQAGVWVRIDGRGSHQNSPELKAFIARQLENTTGGQRVIVDLSSCTGMDSTFMGILTCIATRLEDAGGALLVIHAAGRNGELLRGLGLDALFSVDDEDSSLTCCDWTTPEDCESLCAQESSKTERTGVCLEAHEALAKADARNLPRFRDVIDLMRGELNRAMAH